MHIHLVLMNFDPMGHVELSRLASPLATPNTLNKLTIPVKLLTMETAPPSLAGGV